MSTPLIEYAKLLYALEVRILTKIQPLFLLIVRVHWGYRFFRAGLGKFMNFSDTVEFFSSLGIPAPTINAGMAAGTELLGGLCLALGLGSRIATIPLSFTMLVAYATAHRESLVILFTEGDPSSFLAQEPFLFLFACLIVLVFGGGRFSVDAWLAGRGRSE